MTKLDLLRIVFGDCDDEHLNKFLPFVDDAISTLDEREQCALQSRLRGKTFKETGRNIINLGCKAHRCDGLSVERTRQIQKRAINRLRHSVRRELLRGEISLKELYIKLQDRLP